MNSVDKLVFQLIQASLFDTLAVQLEDRESVFKEMKFQAVAALPGAWLKKNGVHDESWNKFCAMNRARWIKVLYGQRELLNIMNENKIPCVILKGAAAAMYYPHPTLRSVGDVDFLVKREDKERAATILEEKGYILEDSKNETAHHYGYSKDGINFELHWRLAVIKKDDEELLSMFDWGIDHREFGTIEGMQIPVLPTVLNGLVLILHINQHLRGGIGLRHIVDWMMFVDKHEQELKNGELAVALRKTDMEKLAYSTTVVCQKYLGLREIIKNVEEYPWEEFMAYILEMGNFGAKAGVEGHISSFSMTATDPFHFFKRLQEGGMSHWKLAQKYRLFRPVAWVYQLFRIMCIMIKERKKPGDIRKQQINGKKQRQLLNALGLKTDREI